MPPNVSFLVPVYNEAEHIGPMLESIARQTYSPSKLEVVVALARSTDGTADILHACCADHPRLTVRIQQNACRNTAIGRNLCLRAAEGKYIMNFSAHAVAAPEMVEVLVAKLEKLGGDVAGVGCAIKRSDPSSLLARAVGVAMFSRMGGMQQVDSSFTGKQDQPARSIAFTLYRRRVLDDLGGFDEAFWCGQDAELNQRLARHGYRLWFTPDTSVRHHKRSRLGEFIAQMYRYGVARAKLTKKFPRSLRLVFLLPCMFFVVVSIAAVASVFHPGVAWGVLVAAVLFVLLSWASARSAGGDMLSVLLSPLLYFLIYTCYGAGFLRGLLLRV